MQRSSSIPIPIGGYQIRSADSQHLVAEDGAHAGFEIRHLFRIFRAFRHQPSDHTPALGNLDLFPLEQAAFNLLELVAEVSNRSFGHVIPDSITSHFLQPGVSSSLNASPNPPTANALSAPAYSLSSHRLLSMPNEHPPYSFGSAPPSPAVLRPGCVPSTASVCRQQSPATVPRCGAGGWLPRESSRARSAQRAHSLRPRAPQSCVERHSALTQRVFGVVGFRSPARRPFFSSSCSPALSPPRLAPADWRAQLARSLAEPALQARSPSAASPSAPATFPPARSLLEPRADPELVPLHSRSRRGRVGEKALPQSGNLAKGQSRVHRRVA